MKRKLIQITSVTVHPPTAAAAIEPLIKHIKSLTTEQLLELARRARPVKRTIRTDKKVCK